MSAFETLKRKIFEKRWGVIYFQINEMDGSESCEINSLLDSYVERLGFHSIGSAWREVDLPSARRIIVRILHRDLAYSQELMSLNDAQTLTDEVIGLFSQNARFYTNGDYALDEKSKGVGWCPITDATFDTGIVFVDESQIGIIWVEDED